MKRNRFFLPSIWMLAVGFLFLPPPAQGQAAEEDDGTVEIVLHPAAEADPPLRYRLLPDLLDRRPGNAAVDYGKVTSEEPLFHDSKWLKENVYDRMNAPLEELRGIEFEPRTVFDDLDRAARREYCDWQLPIRDQNFYEMTLSAEQETRQFARFLIVRARVHIANRRYDDALYALQTGYALGQQVAEGPTFVHGLIGIAISGMMSRQVQDMVQQPDAPNLYWALTMLPKPLIDLRGAAEAELDAVYLSWPELRNLEEVRGGPEYWRDLLQNVWRQLDGFSEKQADPESLGRPEALAVACLKGYPRAKRYLIEHGMPAERVEAMPVGQVVAIYTVRMYEQLRDDVCKWFYISYPEGHDRFDKSYRRLGHLSREVREIIPLADTFVPAISAACTAVVRIDREIAVLRTLEALRMYGAAHDGRLPQKLNDVTQVPVPPDPVTGQPFRYRLEGDAAWLEGPQLHGAPLKLKIRFAD